MKKVFIAVSNDLISDQRVHKTAETLQNSGFRVLVLGCIKHQKIVLQRNYTIRRFNLFFKKGIAFYAEFNVKLFFILLFSRCNYVLAIDLDTLPAVYLASRFRKYKIVYDSHELFTEVPEIKPNSFQYKTWLFIEKLIVPKLRSAYTVSIAIADIYYSKYRVKFGTIYNFPLANKAVVLNLPEALVKLQMLISKLKKEHKKVVVYQGAVNVGRGIEESIEVICQMDHVVFIIIGEGDIFAALKHKVAVRNLNDKIILTGRIPYQYLHQITPLADAGIALLHDLGLSYRYSLPNRVFDYTHAGIPFMVSNLPETAAFVREHHIALVCRSLDIKDIVATLNELLYNDVLRAELKANMLKASAVFTWDSQVSKLVSYFE